ncbi:MAG: glutamyl-tRNA reductase [Epsilonproteobacteria bacterium]|nr:glutamyl-tRNA reductase [Campylobacterota bacterium]
MYTVISFNYKNSDVATRGKLSILPNHYQDFKDYEIIIVSTCNRCEIVLFTHILNPVLTKIEQLTGVNPQNAFIYKGQEAIKHVFRVLSSLDSMIVGETQITGQYKEAFLKAYEQGTIKKNLSRLMHYGFKCAKRVRNETQISSNPVSVASIAVRYAKEILHDLAGYSAVVVGAGDTARIVCKHLERQEVNIILLNRSIDKAELLKEEIKDVNVEIHSLDKLDKIINQYRLLFSATSSNEPIIKADMVQKRDFDRLWFDLAIPSDIEHIEDETIRVVRVDDLKNIADDNMQKRLEEIKKAEQIVEQMLQEYLDFVKTNEINPTIKQLRAQAEEICNDVLEYSIKKKFIKEEDRKNVQKLLHTAFKRFLHNPTITLKQNANEPNIDMLLSSIRKLFNIADEELDFKQCD